MSENWATIFTTDKEYQAQIIAALLEENEVICQVVNKKDAAYLFGEIEIMVPAEWVIKAKAIIQKSEIH